MKITEMKKTTPRKPERKPSNQDTKKKLKVFLKPASYFILFGLNTVLKLCLLQSCAYNKKLHTYFKKGFSASIAQISVGVYSILRHLNSEFKAPIKVSPIFTV